MFFQFSRRRKKKSKIFFHSHQSGSELPDFLTAVMEKREGEIQILGVARHLVSVHTAAHCQAVLTPSESSNPSIKT